MERKSWVGRGAASGREPGGASIEGAFTYSSAASDAPAPELDAPRPDFPGARRSETAQGWTCRVIGADGDVELEQLDKDGREWYASGIGGDRLGALGEVLTGAAGSMVDPGWIRRVSDVIERDRDSARRSALLVKQVTGTWFHATFAENRASILRHGLDYRRMIGPGIAGSGAPEAAGVFLTCDLEGARWFARMGRHGPTDIWAVKLVEAWLVGDPGAGGGGDDSWMISHQPVSPDQLSIVERDITDSLWSV